MFSRSYNNCAWFNTMSKNSVAAQITPCKHCVAAQIMCKLCEALAVVLVLSTVQGLCRAGSSSPSDDRVELALPLQKPCFSVVQLWSSKWNNYVAIYIKLTQPLIALYTYTLGSAIILPVITTAQVSIASWWKNTLSPQWAIFRDKQWKRFIGCLTAQSAITT